jgi:hypothetical protein
MEEKPFCFSRICTAEKSAKHNQELFTAEKSAKHNQELFTAEKALSAAKKFSSYIYHF